MRITEVIKLLPTQFRQYTDNPLEVGHHIPLIGTWTQETGYLKILSLQYLNESLACPIIAIVEEKIGGEDLVLNITAKISEYSSMSEKTQGSYTIKTKKYSPTETTVETTLTIPRHTRPWATYLLTGLGNKIYEISSITTNVTAEVGRVNFYALASTGSRIIYWLSLHRVADWLREILNGIWISPTKCIRCSGTGIEPDTESDTCLQCSGYRFSGYNATKWIQRMKGFDVGLAREVMDWDNLTDEDHDIIVKFINKAWTQKWWVTPTESEIKRLFSHFYMVDESLIYIQKRYHPQEPVWHLSLPIDFGEGSPFGVITTSDRDLLKYIAESLTPAGVNVFVGFYFSGDFGNLGNYVASKPSKWLFNMNSVAFHENRAPNIVTRWKNWNGWTEANWDFEDPDFVLSDDFYTFGSVGVFNLNDQNRHVLRIVDNSYAEFKSTPTGINSLELWCHFGDNDSYIGGWNSGLSDWTLQFKFLNSGSNGMGLYNYDNALITKLKNHTDHHIRIDIAPPLYTMVVDDELTVTGLSFKNLAPGEFRFLGTGIGSFWVDAISFNGITGYQSGDNLGRLAKQGIGSLNLDVVNGGEGIYKATYNFKDDDVGSFPSGWTIDYGSDMQIISELDEHLKVLELDATADYQICYQTFSNQEAGTVEFYFRGTSVSNNNYMYLHLRSGTTDKIRYVVYTGTAQWRVYNGTTWVALDVDTIYSLNTWVRITITFDADGNALFYLNGDLKDTMTMENPSTNSVNNVYFRIGGSAAHEGYMYIDAVGYSWDDDYEIGDNLEDGISNIWEEYITKDKFWEV